MFVSILVLAFSILIFALPFFVKLGKNKLLIVLIYGSNT